MATTGELRAIVEELELIDIGDAESYLGQEAVPADEAPLAAQQPFMLANVIDHGPTCTCISCQLLHV